MPYRLHRGVDQDGYTLIYDDARCALNTKRWNPKNGDLRTEQFVCVRAPVESLPHPKLRLLQLGIRQTQSQSQVCASRLMQVKWYGTACLNICFCGRLYLHRAQIHHKRTAHTRMPGSTWARAIRSASPLEIQLQGTVQAAAACYNLLGL